MSSIPVNVLLLFVGFFSPQLFIVVLSVQFLTRCLFIIGFIFLTFCLRWLVGFFETLNPVASLNRVRSGLKPVWSVRSGPVLDFHD